MKDLILASTSKYRKQLLSRLGIEFRTVGPDIDEDEYKADISDPTELAEKLGYVKAMAVLKNNPNSIVIGGDQLACIDGKILGKPGTMENAFEQLKTLSGKSHELITATSVCSNKQTFMFCNKTTLTMKPLTDSQINFYLRKDKPIDCAGSYKLELYGIGLFDRIQCVDHTAIVGLPLLELSHVLEKFSIKVFTE